MNEAALEEILEENSISICQAKEKTDNRLTPPTAKRAQYWFIEEQNFLSWPNPSPDLKPPKISKWRVYRRDPSNTEELKTKPN